MFFGPPPPLMSGMMMLGAGSSGGGGAGPTVPQNFTATAGASIVQLSHDPFPGALDYKYYRSLTNNFGDAVLISDPPSDVVGFDDFPPEGELYYYWVVAETAGGDTEPSESASARPWVELAVGNNITLQTPAGSWTVATLLFASSPPGVGMQIQANSTFYDFDGTNWIDLNTFNVGDGDTVSGSFVAVNNSASTFTFWNIEP